MKLLTLEGAAALFAGLAELDHVHHEALEKAAVVVETEARRVLGTDGYNWPALSPSTKKTQPGMLLETSEMHDSIEHISDHHEAHIGSNNDKAVWHELGTTGPHPIPPRPFLGPALQAKTNKVLEIIGLSVVAKLSGTER
jgi:phage gpG-like protein